MSLLPRFNSRARRLGVGLAAALPIVAGPLLLTAAQAEEPSSDPTGNHELRPFEPEDEGESPDVAAPKSHAPSRVPAAHVPSVTGLPVSTAVGVQTRIEGLDLRDQRNANNGNSFSLEPPDQALCVGNGFVIEGVNNVFSIFTTAGARVAGPQSYDPFWNNGTAEIIRHPDGTATFGPFVSDPKCYYDPALGRFFMTELELGTDPDTGDFTGDSFVNIAVSKTSRPTTNAANWHLYELNVRNDGTQGTPSHTGCPCLGDQPLIGADKFGFYVTTNEFPIFQDGFNGAQLYAFDKAGLANGVMKVQRFEQNGTPLAEGIAYSVQPATSPTAGSWRTTANGTEFFLSPLEFTGGLDNRIAVWAMTNTASLATATPAVRLSSKVIASEVYGLPPKVEQKPGPTPLADAVNFPKEELIESNDDRMNQVVFANGRLYSGLNTVVKTENGHTVAGIAFFVVSPSASATTGVAGRVANQGYVAVNGNSVIFPAIGVRAGGAAAMVFTLAGRDFYPSAAMVRLTKAGALTSGVQVIKPGAGPDDGFTGYPAFGGAGVGRWGDYSAAVADTGGNIWLATEYIPGGFGFPEFLANWGTFVASVTP